MPFRSTSGSAPAAPAEPDGPRTGARVLLDRNFGPFFVGNLLSNCGTWVQNIAQALLVFRLTGSNLLVGVVNFSQFIGTFALASWAGAAADRYDRRRLLVVTQLAAVAITGVLAVLAARDAATAPVVIGLALVLGISTAFALPAMLAMVPLLVPDDELAPAVALNSVTFNLARAVGPLLGALIVERLGLATAFGLNALSYLALVAALLVVRPRPQAPAPQERPLLRESMRLVWAERRLALLLGAVVALSVTADPVSTLTPGFATEIFGLKDTWAGVLVGAFGAGAVAAAFLGSGNRGPVERRVAVTLAVLSGGIAGFALSPTMAVAVVALLIGGYGFLAANTAATTAIQIGVDDAQRGRVMALWGMCFLGVRPFASLVDGTVAEVAGLRVAAFVMAVPAAVVAVGFLRRERRAAGARGGAAPLLVAGTGGAAEELAVAGAGDVPGGDREPGPADDGAGRSGTGPEGQAGSR
jgi:MFS family permease